MSECKCTFAQKMVGDGCDICNPGYIESLSETEENCPLCDYPYDSIEHETSCQLYGG